MLRVLGVAVLAVAAVTALPQNSGASDVQTLLSDPPAAVPKPGIPVPDSDGIIVEDVVNVHKSAIILIMSTATPQGIHQRQLVRDTYLQPLNRSSPYALKREERRQFSAWFVVPRDLDNPASMVPIEAEGKLHGDILIVNPMTQSRKPDSFDVFGALVRWARVAYFERYDNLLITNDDSFVSIYNLRDYCAQLPRGEMHYHGYVNSFEPSPNDPIHKFYPPFVEAGTILMSYPVSELISRELSLIRHLPRYDITIGSFLMPYSSVKPTFSPKFVAELKHVYSAVAAPVVINHVSEEQMRLLSTPQFVDGKWVTPELPAQNAECQTRSVWVDPHPKDPEPLCTSLSANSKCSQSELARLKDSMTKEYERRTQEAEQLNP